MSTRVSSWRPFALAPTITIMLTAAPALAQQETDGRYDTGTIEEVIVTGTAGGAEIRKFDATFAITTMSDEDITRYSPQSTADLLKLVPGVWSESSGGVAGANIFVRGFPGGGDAPFYSLHVNGSPLYPPPTLSFLENSTLFRIDETVQRVEALRGGSNPVFSNGQPGLTTNFILREGSEDTQGLIKYKTSDYDLRRVDAYLSGELADELYYMIGGYISSSPGIRDSSFNSDEGNQFTINLTKDLDNGTINVFHRQTDDHGTWYGPVPLNVPGVDAEYNQIGTLNRQRQVMYMDAGEQRSKLLDLGEGRGWDGFMSGGSVTLDITSDWELTERFSITKGDADTVGVIVDGAAVNVGDLLANPATDPRAVVIGPITGSVSGRDIGPEEFIQQVGAWEVRKQIEGFTNDISLARAWDRGTFTAGFYAANASSDDQWNFINTRYEVVRPGAGEVVTGIECNDPTIESCSGIVELDQVADATTTALYAATTFDVTDRLTLDLGVRAENYEAQLSVDGGRDGQVDTAIDYDESEFSWTAAVNFLFTDSISAFARINSGSKMPTFNELRDASGALEAGINVIQEVEQAEVGLKWVTDYLSIYATGFYNEVDPTFNNALAGGQQAEIEAAEAMGVELDAIWETDAGFSISLNSTIQESEVVRGPNSGNESQRQPGWQVRLSPAYDFEFGDVVGTLYGTIYAVDDRWSENENVNKLDGYEKLDLGVIFRVNEAFVVQFAANNVTDEDALTEADPRTLTARNGRFIMPRTFEFSIGYEF